MLTIALFLRQGHCPIMVTATLMVRQHSHRHAHVIATSPIFGLMAPMTRCKRSLCKPT
ncbi:hypothetical protein CHELA40_11030 [Chelatococcus asaccharovorans]|nr:hypothetical protein CHELA40_11030 [Chelatococcus asaccharovorans]CAH1685559.1 hypothetical protein CHELA17_64567 [Chelatococcus asaccharovorans]